MVRSSKTVVTRPMSLHDGDGLAVAHRHAGRLLAAVLQGEHAVEGELRDGLARRVHAEDTAGFFHWALIALPSLRRTFRGSPLPRRILLAASSSLPSHIGATVLRSRRGAPAGRVTPAPGSLRA